MNNPINDQSIKNFISKPETNDTSRLKFVVPGALNSKINERSDHQYDCGDIIVVNVQKHDESFIDGRKQIETYIERTPFVVLSKPINNNILIAPLLLIPLFSSFQLDDYIVDLGIIPFICDYKLACADLSSMQLIGIDEFISVVEEECTGGELEYSTLAYAQLKKLIKRAKNLFFGGVSKHLVVI